MSLAGDNDSYREMRSLLEEINRELGKKTTNLGEAKKAYSSIASTLTKLALQEEDITRYSDKQLNNYNVKAKAALAEIKSRAELLAEDKKILATDKFLQKQKINQLRLAGEITDEEKSLLLARRDGFQMEQGILDKVNAQVEKRKEANKAMGISGALLKSITDLSPELAKGLKIDEITKDMQEFADATVEAEGKASRLKTLGVGIKSAFKNLGDTLTDPAVVFGALIAGFTKVENAQKEFRSQTGQNIQQFGLFNGSLLTTAEYMKAAVELSKELGVNAAVVFSEDTIIEVGELTEHMGLGAKEAANLAKFAKLSGKELSTVTGNTFKATSEFIKTNKVGISVKDVFNDIGNVSDSISLSLGGQPGKIRDAALAARELGLSLAQVDNIAGSLLQFESSISAELEAELITGKALNLEKAREYALMNNIKGVAKELIKNQAVMQAFASGNRVEQEAVAKAMGMNREEMSKMIFNQKMIGGLSAEQARKAADIGEEEAKRLTVQKQITNAIDKVTQAFGGLLTFITPLLTNTTALTVVMGTLAAIYTTKMIVGLIGTVTQLGLQLGLTTANTAATVAASAANGVLATTQTAVGASGVTAAAGMVASGTGLGFFGSAAAAGVPVILALAAAAVGVGFALRLATPAIVAIGGVIGTIFKGIATVVTSVTQGFATMFSTISMDNILPIMLLGPALAGIGAGLALIAVSGTLALPALLALTALGTVAIGLNSIFGDDESTSPSSNNEMAEVNANLKKLISAVEQGGVVMLDSNKIGEYLPKILQLNEFKIGG